MKKVIFFSVVIIALLASGAAIFFMNFDIIKKEEVSRKEERTSFKVCGEKDIERFNIAVENLDILELKKIKTEVASRKDYDKDINCVSMAAIYSIYSSDNSYSDYLNKIKSAVDNGINPSLKIRGVGDIYYFEKPNQENRKVAQ